MPSNCSDSESEGNVTVVGISPTVSVNEVRDAVPGPSKASADAHVSNADAHVSNDEVKVSNDDDAHKDDTPDDSTSEVNSQSSSSVTNSQVSTNKVDIQGSKPSDSTSSDNVKDGELNENIESDSNNGDNEYEDVDDDDDDEKDFISPTQPGYHKSSLVRKRKSKRIVKSSKKWFVYDVNWPLDYDLAMPPNEPSSAIPNPRQSYAHGHDYSWCLYY